MIGVRVLGDAKVKRKKLVASSGFFFSNGPRRPGSANALVHLSIPCHAMPWPLLTFVRFALFEFKRKEESGLAHVSNHLEEGDREAFLRHRLFFPILLFLFVSESGIRHPRRGRGRAKSKSALRSPADEAGNDHSSPPPPRRVLGCSRDLAVGS